RPLKARMAAINVNGFMGDPLILYENLPLILAEG
ncbi:hypothetical protein PSYMO_38423, partial [Pseudomonas amygdali pv. mori str. 301020]